MTGTLKGLDLRICPIHRGKETRVREHICYCLLAYYVDGHLRRAWASPLCDDEALLVVRATGAIR